MLAAVIVHAIIIALVIWLLQEEENAQSASAAKPQQRQIVKLSLKENPEAPKEALVKNDRPKQSNHLPIPKGEQLSRPVDPAPETAPVETQTTTPPSAQPQESVTENTQPPEQTETYEQRMVRELYGDVFGELSEGEQKFILDNQETMRRITQNILGRYAPYRIPPGLDINESNLVEFVLHPDGHVTDLRFIQNSRYELFDNVTLETLGIAYKKYPRPAQPTLIRYRIDYVLGGG